MKMQENFSLLGRDISSEEMVNRVDRIREKNSAPIADEALWIAELSAQHEAAILLESAFLNELGARVQRQ